VIEGITRTCFVLGCQRSGTTLTGHVLSAPPDAVLFDEIDGLYDWYRDRTGGPGQILEKSRAKYSDPAGRFVTGPDGRVALAPGVRSLVLKAPNLTYDIAALHRLAVPAALVFAVRDPRSVVASMLRLQTDFPGNQARLLAASAWADDLADDIAFLRDTTRPRHQRLALLWRIKTGFCRQLGAGPLPAHMVRYEDLVAAPEPTLRALCAAIGLRFDPAMLAHRQIYQGRSQGNFERTRAIDTTSTDRWRNELSPQQQRRIAEIAGPLMQELGYA
jgi:hypothetical protein